MNIIETIFNLVLASFRFTLLSNPLVPTEECKHITGQHVGLADVARAVDLAVPEIGTPISRDWLTANWSYLLAQQICH